MQRNTNQWGDARAVPDLSARIEHSKYDLAIAKGKEQQRSKQILLTMEDTNALLCADSSILEAANLALKKYREPLSGSAHPTDDYEGVLPEDQKFISTKKLKDKGFLLES